MAKNDHIKPVKPAPGPQPTFNHPNPFPARKPLPVEKKRVQVMKITDPMVALDTRRAAIVQELRSYGKATDSEQEVMGQAQEKVKANKRARQRAGTSSLPQKQVTKSVHGTPQKSIIPQLYQENINDLRGSHEAHTTKLTEARNAAYKHHQMTDTPESHAAYVKANKALAAHKQSSRRAGLKEDREIPGKPVETLQEKKPVYMPGHKFAVVARVKRQINAPDSGPTDVNTIRVKSTTKGVGPRTFAPAAALEKGVTPMIKNNLIGRRARLEAEFRPQNTSGEN